MTKQEINLDNYGITDSTGEDITFTQLATFYEGFLNVIDGWADRELSNSDAWRELLRVYLYVFCDEEELEEYKQADINSTP